MNKIYLLGKNSVGKYITESGSSWRIVGVFQDEGGDREERNLYVPYTTRQQITNSNEVDQMIVVYDKKYELSSFFIIRK